MVSGSEVAFFSLTHNDFARLREDQSRQADRILRLKEKPRTLLATILISNNFINIAIVLVSEYMLRTALPDQTYANWASALQEALPFISWPAEYWVRVINFSITVVAVTFLLVLFGEVAPKIYARINNVQLAKAMSGPLVFLVGLFQPLSRLLVRGTSVIERKLEKRRPNGPPPTSRQDIDEAIELTVRDEHNARQEIDILKSIVKFGDVTVKQIMRSRVDVVAVDFQVGFDELIAVVKESGYSRIPIYKEDFDHITGILYVKDLLGYLHEQSDFEWQSLIRPNLLYVPEAKKINDMLKEFQSQRMHLAIVVDEYGGTSGIVTLEDILEEVIGEIRDEFDDEEEMDYNKIDEFNYLFEGKTLINDVCRIVGVNTSTFDEIRGDADSLAGLVLELAGQIPKKDTEYAYNGFKFKIVTVGKRRIEQIRITLPPE
ncbi:MAG: gliding motility-associated protein GldE [Saprospiraceae bacterium]|nr:gliding motility-associated protein GldE [Saprospiraceae bacterium]MCB0625247.1 gliding motility-associated protein GldE [Saprospiraceae bacterium]MCB0677434.1 gliding motility-associated protein GldE [Saprospiraceae bacterium]MCB0681823.1 gliding motility-associated protein GldE [Saprospiraceae bacterium]